jgi:formiminotetrahydrofolate cyclodeaminase
VRAAPVNCLDASRSSSPSPNGGSTSAFVGVREC